MLQQTETAGLRLAATLNSHGFLTGNPPIARAQFIAPLPTVGRNELRPYTIMGICTLLGTIGRSEATKRAATGGAAPTGYLHVFCYRQIFLKGSLPSFQVSRVPN